MSTVYVPVLIESEEQAEKFPVGTVAVWIFSDGSHGRNAHMRRPGGWELTGWGDVTVAKKMVGWTALVPVEAEEERTRVEPFGDGTIHVSPQYWRDDPSRRLVTPWTPDGPAAISGRHLSRMTM